MVALAPEIAEGLARRFLADLRRSQEIREGPWSRRPLGVKAVHHAVGLAEPWL